MRRYLDTLWLALTGVRLVQQWSRDEAFEAWMRKSVEHADGLRARLADAEARLARAILSAEQEACKANEMNELLIAETGRRAELDRLIADLCRSVESHANSLKGDVVYIDCRVKKAD